MSERPTPIPAIRSFLPADAHADAASGDVFTEPVGDAAIQLNVLGEPEGGIHGKPT